MAGYILILAIIILGGAIATVGDRLGTKVGKARLSLFNLRPRTTAVLITILTGSIISASTLGILLATNKQLRDAIFRIGSIQKELAKSEKDLEMAKAQKEQIQNDLEKSTAELGETRSRLQQVDRVLDKAIARQRQTQTRLNQLQTRYLKAQQDLKTFDQQSRTLKAEILELGREAQQLQVERQKVQERLLQAESQKQKAQLEQTRLEVAVKQTQQQLQQVDTQRTALVKQQSELKNEIASLEASRKRLTENVEVLLLGLRRGNITIRTGQVLSAGLVQGTSNRDNAVRAVDQLLREARKKAIILANPKEIPASQRVVQITNQDVERLIQQLSDGQSYVVRILSAANYLEGETSVFVVPQIARNQVIFSSGQRVASVTLNPDQMTDDQIINRLDSLFATSNQRAIQGGILPDPLTGAVGSFRQIDLVKFVLDLKEQSGNIEVVAIAPQDIYTAGPLLLELVAFRNGQVLLRSR
jgi:uncharacterized protein (DUF3084 family)